MHKGRLMAVKFAIPIFLSIVFSTPANSKTIMREGEAIVTLVDFQAPDKVKQGELFKVYADFKLSKTIPEGAGLFLHMINTSDGKDYIHADFSPDPAVSSWASGEIVGVGPICLYAPREIPAGEYNISMGIITSIKGPEGLTYIREPYTNASIKDFAVGKVVFEENPEKEEKDKEAVISDFKNSADVNKWECRDAVLEMSVSTPPDGKVKFLPHVEYPAIFLENFFRKAQSKFTDWSRYDFLELELYQDPDASGSTAVKKGLMIQVKDARGNKSKIFIDEPPQKGTPVKIRLAKLTKDLDLSRVTNFTVCAYSVSAEYVFYISNVKLTSYPEYAGTGPFIKFEGIELSKDKIYPGEDLELSLSFSIDRKFYQDHILFIHIGNPESGGGFGINADVTPRVPTTDWEIGKVIKQGPFNIHIPAESPPGNYVIEAGFSFGYEPPAGALYAKYHRAKNGIFYIDQPKFPVDYIKQPYVNYQEYGDWIVGSFEVISGDAGGAGKKE